MNAPMVELNEAITKSLSRPKTRPKVRTFFATYLENLKFWEWQVTILWYHYIFQVFLLSCALSTLVFCLALWYSGRRAFFFKWNQAWIVWSILGISCVGVCTIHGRSIMRDLKYWGRREAVKAFWSRLAQSAAMGMVVGFCAGFWFGSLILRSG